MGMHDSRVVRIFVLKRSTDSGSLSRPSSSFVSARTSPSRYELHLLVVELKKTDHCYHLPGWLDFTIHDLHQRNMYWQNIPVIDYARLDDDWMFNWPRIRLSIGWQVVD